MTDHAQWVDVVTSRRVGIRRRWRRLRGSDLPTVLAGAFAALLMARMAAGEQWQDALTIVALLCAAATYARWPTAGVGIVLGIWVLAPFTRRLLDYVAPSFGPDLLSLTPFLATAGIALIALRRHTPSRHVVVVLCLYWAALAIGVPLGLSSPSSLVFGLFAFTAASLSLLVGYVDGARGELALQRALLWAVPVLAVYGIAQYALPLTPWDDLWVRTAGFASIGTKEDGTLRPFSLLNSPGTLALVLAVVLIILLARRQRTPLLGGVAALALACLAVTGVRTAWLSLGLAALLLVPVSRGRAIPRVAALVLVLGLLYAAFGGTSAGQRAVDRASSVADAGDVSVTERLQALVQLGPQAVTAPIGHGVGSAGQSARASATGVSELVDNGYLILLWQVGPLGFVLALASIALAIAHGVRGPPHDPEVRGRLLAPVLLLLVAMASGEVLYGLGAILLWYHLGALMGLAEAGPTVSAKHPARIPTLRPRS